MPELIKPIPTITTNEGAAFGPIDLKPHFSALNPRQLQFSAELTTHESLPAGLICTQDGLLSGIAKNKTAGDYDITLNVTENDSTTTARFKLTIKTRFTTDDPSFLDKLKSQVWQAVGDNAAFAGINNILDRPVTAGDMYYLLQRWGMLSIWDIYNLEAPSAGKLLNIPGASEHYHIYDRGSCLVAAPKDLFSYERTLEDALQTSRALAHEVYSRGWTIELSGFNKMIRAAWIELQLLGDKHGKRLDILHYTPEPDDLKLYTIKSEQAVRAGVQN
jgi:hypothetical protein